jgi:hypothetical protein
MYRASLRLASQTYSYGAVRADELKRATTGLVAAPTPTQGANGSGQQQTPAQAGAQQQQEQKKR